MKNQTLKNALPLVMRALAEDLGVQVVWGAAHAHTWDKVIYLPNLEESEGVSKLALGFGTHESAHIIYSDQSVYEKAAQEAPFVVKLMNAMEDVRIEGLMFGKYPSVRSWLDHTVRVVLGGVQSSDGLSEAAILHNAALLNGRHRLLNQPLAAEAASALDALRNAIGVGRSTKVMALLGKIPACADTEAIYQLTHAILDVLDEEMPEDSDPQDQDQANDGQNGDAKEQQSGGEQGDDSQSGSGQGEQSSTDSHSSLGSEEKQGDDGKSGGSKSGSESGSDNGKEAAHNSQQGTAGAPSTAGKKSLKEKVLGASPNELNELKSDLGEAVSKVLNATPSSGMPTPAAVQNSPFGDAELGSAAMALGRAASMGMRQVLMGLVQGQQNAQVVMRRTGRQIDGSRLARVAVGENRVFRKSDPVQRPNAAFQILLDASGSMRQAMLEAEAAVIAVLHSLEGMSGITTGAMVFPRAGVANTGCTVGVMKRHNKTLMRSFQESRFGITASGGTPLAQALWPAAGELLAAKGQRKVLVVITDGEPDDAYAAKAMIERCRASGIDVFAVAVSYSNPVLLNAVYGPKYWTDIPSVTQLRDSLNHLVKAVLTNAA